MARRVRFVWEDPGELARQLRRGEVTKEQVIKAARKDPVGWIKNVLGVKLYEKQEQIVKSLYRHKRLAVQAAFSVGKTFLAAAIALHFLYNYAPSKVITIAPTWRQVIGLLWREIRKLYKRALDRGWGLIGNLKKTELEIDEDWFAMGFSTQTSDEQAIDRITGFHQENMLVIMDQAGGLGDLWWRAVKTMLAGRHNYWLALGNTAIWNCPFRRICLEGGMPGLGRWHVEKITAYDSPNVRARRTVIPGLVSWEWVRDMESLGRDDPLFRIYVLAEFVAESDLLLIPTEALEAARTAEINISPEPQVAFGLDVALDGGDYSVLIGLDRRTGQLLVLRRIRGNRTHGVVSFVESVVNQVKQVYAQSQPTLVAVDAVGIGAGVYDLLTERLSVPVIPIIGSESPQNPRAFLNKRSESAWQLREAFSGRQIRLQVPQDRFSDLVDRESYGKLLDQLQNMPYQYDQHGRIKLPPKTILKGIFGHSPDEFDALVYAHQARQVAEASVVRVVTPQTQEELNPFEDPTLWEEVEWH